MLMHRWSPPSQIPVTSLDYNSTETKHMCLRWCKLILSMLILFVLIAILIVYTLQKESLFNKEYEHKQQDEFNQRQQLLVDAYMQDISTTLLQLSENDFMKEKVFLHIQSKTLMILRSIELKRKKDILLFLYERNLLQNNQLNLRGADLNNVEFICPQKTYYFHISGVSWSKAIFINCNLTYANFDYADLMHAQFINSTIRNASLIQTKLDNSHFIQTIIMRNNFHGASLIQVDMRQTDIVQDNDFTNADLYQAKLTDDQLEGKKVAIIKNNFAYARLPNGSFGLLNSKDNLIVNGNAEMECSLMQQTTWTPVDSDTTLIVSQYQNITNENETMVHNAWGNCSFLTTTKIRVYQTIDLHSYSTLIDTQNAAISFIGFASCNESYIEIHMYDSNDILYQSKIYEKPTSAEISYHQKTMYKYAAEQEAIQARTRRIRFYFGIARANDIIECHFDNIILNIDQIKK